MQTSVTKAAEYAASRTIEPDVLYRLDEFEERMGWKRGTTRNARNNGLVVRYAGRRGYVLGRDAIEYIEQYGRLQK